MTEEKTIICEICESKVWIVKTTTLDHTGAGIPESMDCPKCYNKFQIPKQTKKTTIVAKTKAINDAVDILHKSIITKPAHSKEEFRSLWLQALEGLWDAAIKEKEVLQ